MKKIFTLIAAAFMAVGANAQTIDYTGMKDGDFTVSNATLNSGSTSTKKMYDITGGAVLEMYLNAAPSVIFQITNNSAKQKIFVLNLNDDESTDKGSVEFGGKNGIAIFNTVQVDDVIKMNVAAKGGSAATIGVLPSSGDELMNSLTLPAKSKGAEGADAEGYIWKEFSFTVSEDMLKSIDGNKVVRVKEVSAGYRCKAIAINADLPTGINDVKVVEPATVEGAIYNLSGQKVNENYKGVVIKNGKKVVVK